MDLDINKILQEVEADVKALLKSAQKDAETLYKAEESKKEESEKEESKKEESKEKSKMEKADEQEGSVYENQAPEASKDFQDQMEQEDDMDEDENLDNEDLVEMLKGLSDEELQYFFEKVKSELDARMQSQEDMQSQQQMQEPAMQQQEQLKMSKSLKEKEQALRKAQEFIKAKDQEIEELKKTLNEMYEIVKTLTERPVSRAISGIQYVSKENSLQKSEMTYESIKKSLDELTKNKEKLASLTKSELSAIEKFYLNKKVSDELIKIINK